MNYASYNPDDLERVKWLDSHSLWKFHLWFRVYYDYHPKVPTAYYWERYGLYVPLRPGRYDGATAALDLKPKNGNCPHWLAHDNACDTPIAFNKNGDKEEITAEMAAELISDVLIENGHLLSAPVRKYVTYWLGCKKTRKN